MGRATAKTLEGALPRELPPALVVSGQPGSKSVLVPADSLPGVQEQMAGTRPFSQFLHGEAEVELALKSTGVCHAPLEFVP